MLFLETVKKICGSNENLYEAILSLYKNDPEHFVFTFCNELDAKVNNAYAAGVLDQIFANDGIQFNVLGASVRLSVGKQEHTVIYNAGFGGVRNDSVNITIMDEVARICSEEGNSFSLNRGDPHYRNRIALDAYELAKPKIKEQLRKKLPKYSVRRNVY